MRKRKVLAVFISAILALSLTACGTVTVTTAQPEPQPAAEVETPTPTPVEEPEVTPEPTEEPKEEVVEEPVADESATEEVATEETEVPMTPMDALLNSNMSEYISEDGVFDLKKFCDDDSRTAGWAVTEEGTFALIYTDGWFIESGEQDGVGFVAVGDWDFNATDRANFYTYSYTFSEGDDVEVSDGSVKICVPAECVIHLADIVSFASENGVKVAPDTVGTEFKSCEPEDATTQY